jgi:hypothetical protein
LRLGLIRVRRAGLSLIAVVRLSRRAAVSGLVERRRAAAARAAAAPAGAAAPLWKRVRRLRPRTLGPGRRMLRTGRLRPGRYRLRLTARAATSRATATLRFRVAARA